ncbi:hypothetical protein G5I_11608 [Acromyrmex echinatior]|uniref:Uncharacterized protein n=1 Tax=Acromyrmex echinatior TaxID=103372 RepID=F4X026_ACREC|nr:hypothetical protein G5I_11608 [Acromyrmex echinatior]
MYLVEKVMRISVENKIQIPNPPKTASPRSSPLARFENRNIAVQNFDNRIQQRPKQRTNQRPARLASLQALEEIAVFPVRSARVLSHELSAMIESLIAVVANQRQFSNDNESARSPSDFRAETAAEGIACEG